MDTKKEAKKYLNKYFKAQYLKETDDEYKSLVRLLNKALRIHDVSGCNASSDKLVECSNCGDKVEMISSGEFCPHCLC